MPAPRWRVALTAELVARAAPVVEDAGPSPGAVYLADAEYDALVREGRAGTRPPAGDLWAFGCGSPLWKPGLGHAEAGRRRPGADAAPPASGWRASAAPAA